MNFKKGPLVPLSFLALILLGALIFYLTLDFRFTDDKNLGGFPIPDNAELISKDNGYMNYDTNSVSSEEGPGFSYSMKLKKDGWKEKKLEGSTYLFKKGSTKIEMESSDDHMSVKSN